MSKVPSKKKMFLVWDTNIAAGDPDAGYWCFYDSLEDAVDAHGDGVEVFAANPKSIGRFRKTVAPMPEKPLHKKKAAKVKAIK